jgi:hypothetical protein
LRIECRGIGGVDIAAILVEGADRLIGFFKGNDVIFDVVGFEIIRGIPSRGLRWRSTG